MRRAIRQGFTLIEMVVVIAIIGIMVVLTVDRMMRARPRATFEGAAAEIQSLVHAARQEALASGHSVVVLVFPDYPTHDDRVGRIVVVREDTDPAQSLFANPPPPLSFGNYPFAAPVAPGNGAVVTTYDLPQGVVLGPDTGVGGTTLPFPYNNAITNVACSFCVIGSDHRGAIRFDDRGRVDFPVAPASATQPVPSGHSFTVMGTQHPGRATFVVTIPVGTVRTFHNG